MIKGSFVSVGFEDKDGNPIQWTIPVGHSATVPVSRGEQQYLRITNNAGMAHPHSIRVVIMDQVCGAKPMYDIEPYCSILVPISAKYTYQMLVVAVYPIRKREPDEEVAEVGMDFTGPFDYDKNGAAGPAKRDWVSVSVEPEVFTVLFRVT